jgi:hypothetical protein
MSNWFDNKTLDEIEEHFVDNLKHLQGKMVERVAHKPDELFGLYKYAMQEVCRHLDIPLEAALTFSKDQAQASSLLDTVLKEKGIRIESYDNPEHPDRIGLYFYKANEIAHCIMAPMATKLLGSDCFLVRSTA